jgi:cobyrinic acid a,c-diamide synthase
MEKNMHSLVFAAPKSNSGKTMIVCGLTEVFKRKKYEVNMFKCGPDYIDPMFHRRVLGVESGNLDTFFTDDETTKYLYARKAEKADITIIEGVMGYYDGLGGQSERASTYEVARLTKSPVVLVVDCKGASVSLAAVIKGIKDYRSDSNIRAVILNRVSPMYYERLKSVIENDGIEVVGYVPEKEELKLGSRHLGLVTPTEMEAFNKWVSNVADVLEKTVDIDRLHEIAKTSGFVSGSEPKISVLKNKVRIAVARDEAFSFYYSENEELIEKTGGELVYFSPLKDKSLPENIDGIILSGGYPELYAKQLSENTDMRKAIKNACKSGVPVIAECGGFMYLQNEIEGNDGIKYEMCCVLDGKAYKTNKLSRFGYIELKCQKSGILGEKGSSIRAHEFHYWDCDKNGSDFTASKPLGGRKYDCIVHKDNIAAGYPHLYFYANPDMLYSYLTACLGYRVARLSKLHWDSIAKPIDSLGLLEDNVVKLCKIALNPKAYDISKRALVVMCGDHGVVSEGVTQTGSDVTKIVADNLAKKCSTVCYMAKSVNADVFAVDVGIDCEEYENTELTLNSVANRKVARGTKNIAKEAAMTKEQCLKAIQVGIDVVKELKEKGYTILATGEMGIGNTTPTSALAAVLLNKSAEEVTGKGAGLSNDGIKKKIEVVKAASERVKEKNLTDAVGILAEIGGYDIAGMVGMFLGGVKYRVPIIIDGAISSVAALVAKGIDQRVTDFALASHSSEEMTSKLALEALGLEAVIHGKMCMGEGTGSVALFPILDMALSVYKNLEYFGDFDIEPYRRFE